MPRPDSAGYLITNDVRYLTPFVTGRAAALPELDALDRLVDDDPAQNDRVERARVETRGKLQELDETVALMRDGRRTEALARIREGSGVTAMDQLRGTIQQIQFAENIRLVALNRAEERRRLWSSIGIIVALAALAFAAWQQLRTRQRRSRLLAISNAELEQIVGERTQQLENERLRIEALLRDVNHRVGNNLAMVSALLNVQSRQTHEPAVRTALSQAQSRIQAIAAGQRRLRLDIETDEIDARPYMEDLLAEIGKAAEGPADRDQPRHGGDPPARPRRGVLRRHRQRTRDERDQARFSRRRTRPNHDPVQRKRGGWWSGAGARDRG